MKIKLTEWAARRYDPPPPMYTLRRWAREGEIHPQPELMTEAEAKEYPGAERVPSSMQLRPLPESAAEHEHTSGGFDDPR